MRVLVTGCSGFLGQHLFRKLESDSRIQWLVGVSRQADEVPHNQQTRIEYFFCDLEQGWQVRLLMQEVQPDVVFHLAANPIVKDDVGAPTNISKTNILATHNLLAYAPLGCRFVFASSATVYGNNAHNVRENVPLSPNSVYGATKVASEALVAAFHEQHKIRGLCFRLVANVGHGATHGLLLDILKKLKGPRPDLELLGDFPGSEKHYIHVSDTVDAFVALGFSPLTGSVNIANTTSLSVQSVADETMRMCGISKPVKWLGEAANWSGDNKFVFLDSRLARNHGWEAKLTSLQAIRRAVFEMTES